MDRRFTDRPPPLPDDPFDVISDSDWTRLDEPARTAELKRQQAAMMARHQQLVAGQASISHRIDAQARQLKLQAEATKKIADQVDAQAAELSKNTAATDRVEKNTEQIVTIFKAVEGGLKVVQWLGATAGKLAWVAIPLAAIVGGWHAVKAWLVNGGGFR